jgi:hypothetical protein
MVEASLNAYRLRKIPKFSELAVTNQLTDYSRGDGSVLGAQSTYIGRDETGSVYLPTQLERTLQLYW